MTCKCKEELEKEVARLKAIIMDLKCCNTGSFKRQFDERGMVIYKEHECSTCDVCVAKEKANGR